MDDGFRNALKTICAGEATAALITVTRVKGSTPRKPGAKMLLLQDGQTFGTIGGGCGEAEVRSEALSALDSQRSRMYAVNMTNDTAEEEGMVCGGIMEVFIDVLRFGPSPEKELLKAYLEDLELGKEPVLITVIDTQSSTNLGEKFYFTSRGGKVGRFSEDSIIEAARSYAEEVRPGGKTFAVTLEDPHAPSEAMPKDENNREALQDLKGSTFTRTSNFEHRTTILVEPAPAPVELVILGGGHIALPLATMAKILGYSVSVVDDRPSFANPGRFPGLDRVICDNFGKALEQLELGPKTFVVIVTRGHKHDKICLSRVITEQVAYIGMIGSRRRVKALLAELVNEGVSRKLLTKVYSPIGLDIGAETPEEIAVSILAELVNVNKGGNVPSMKLSEIEYSL